jgi:hypothetical protein
MKKFKEIKDFSEIKVKTDFCELKAAIYGVNSYIYKYKESFAFKPLVEQLKTDLISEGVKIDNIQVSEKCTKHKTDVIAKLKCIIHGLTGYLKDYTIDNSFEEAINTSMRFQIRSFLKDREENKLSVENCLGMLKRNQLLYNSKTEIEDSLNIVINFPNFIKLQDDIKKELYKLIDVYDFGKSN